MHPKDERYKKFHGKTLVHPFTDRKIPVVLDDVLVDMELGTGAVKVQCGGEFLPRCHVQYIEALRTCGGLSIGYGAD